MTGLGLESNYSTLGRDRIFYYHRGIAGGEKIQKPVLVLLHGYPQSWRHLIPLLPKDIPPFIPDVPGYGRSMGLVTPHGQRFTLQNMIPRLTSMFPPTRDGLNTPVIIVGHDRGARLCHRMAVDVSLPTHNKGGLNIVGAVFLDIVPTLVQFQSFSTPSLSVRTFHWPFLANVELATDMIQAYGGDKWVKMCIDRWRGKSDASREKLEANNAVEKYAEFFKKGPVIHASCDDYRSGSDEDVRLQENDQNAKKARKIDIDVLVLYSADYLGKRYDVRKVWESWMGKGNLEVEQISDECGHFIAEEKPVETAAAILKFYNSVE
ncbi:alpha/beta-hydrolase [Acephala macrosclerotiorum]|nr:alpha/beta-hydrolase [Acephala macrosclerotiorum]